jgi:hypothetical protein
MRIKATIAVILLAVIVSLIALLVDNRSITPVELENVRSVCPECHGEVPEYEFAIKVHNKHAAFECGFCHRDIGPLKTVDSIHKTFKWLCIGMFSLSLMGVLINFFVSNKKNRAN